MSQTNKERFKLLFFVALMMAVDEYKAEVSSFEHSYLTIVYPVLFGIGLINTAYKTIKPSRSGIFIKTTFDTPKQVFLIALSIITGTSAFYTGWNTMLIFWLILYTATYLLFQGVFYQKTIYIKVANDLLHLEYKYRAKHDLTSLNSFELENNTLRLHTEDKTVEVYNVSMQQRNIDKLTEFLDSFRKS